MRRQHMVKKKSRKSRASTFFRMSRSNDPINNILAAALNIIVRHGLERLSRDIVKILDLEGPSPESQIKLNRSFISLEKSKLDIAQANRKEAEAQERAEQWRLKQQKQKQDDEKRSKLLDLDIEEKEIQVEKARQQLENIAEQRAGYVLNARVEPISGALEICASPDGLSSPIEMIEAYNEWTSSLKKGKVFFNSW